MVEYHALCVNDHHATPRDAAFIAALMRQL